MADAPLVSVCVVTFNQARYIQECLESALAQANDVAIEILVGDDASDDGTSDIVARVAASASVLRHLRHERRIGPSANVRAVMAEARGRYIARLDGDDFWLPGKLRRQVDHLERNPDCAACYTQAMLVDDDGIRRGLFNDLGDVRLGLADLVRRGNLLNSSSLLFRAEAAVDWLSADGEFLDYRGNLCLARRGWLDQIGQALAGYRVAAPGSLVAHANEHVRQLYWDALRTVRIGEVSPVELAQGMADFLRRVAFRAMRTGDPALFGRWWRQVMRARPVGRARMLGMLAWSIARAGGGELWGRLPRPGGARERILYRS